LAFIAFEQGYLALHSGEPLFFIPQFFHDLRAIPRVQPLHKTRKLVDMRIGVTQSRQTLELALLRVGAQRGIIIDGALCLRLEFFLPQDKK
jgi:hypothetical protein